jgi:putative ABC transport system permease protein
MNALLQDLRYALRVLAKNPGFTAVAVLTLALGIGANTAIFTVANSVLLRPLPFSHPERLLMVSLAASDNRSQLTPMSWLRFTTIRDQNRSFSGIAAFTNETFSLSGHGDPMQVSSARVTGNFFDVLGVRPALGRAFLPNEDQPGGTNVILLSHSFWIRTLGGTRDVVGQDLTLDTRDYTIIGVLPANFQFSLLGRDVDLWAPRVYDLNLITPQQVQRGSGFLTAVARLRSGITRDQAQADLDILNQGYQRDYPGRPDSDARRVVNASDLRDQLVANVRPAVLLLSSAVALLLLIACANVASLLFSHALGRRKELAVRAAIGASRGNIVRQLLVESTLLGLIGGVAGALLASWFISAAAGTALVETIGEIHLDYRVLTFTAVVSLASGVLFGLLPSLLLSRPDLNQVLRDEGRGSTAGRGRSRVRNTLVIAQVALSMILLIASGLLLRSFIRLETTSPGFDPDRVITMRIELPPAHYAQPPQMIAFYQEILRRAGTLPGVEAAAISSALPVNPIRFAPVLFEGQAELPLAKRPIVCIQAVSPDYSRTLRVPLVRGRSFTDRDDATGPRFVMVNETLARRFWPNQDAIGKKVWVGTLAPAQVVGVLADVKNISLAAETNPEVFLPFPQLAWAHLNLSVRTSNDPARAIPAVRREIAAIDKDLPVTGVQTIQQLLDASASDRRVTIDLLAGFSATALLLALVGIYGLVAYSVTQRTGELGVRIALGASRSDILRLVVGEGLRLTCYGIAIGVAGSLALTRALSSMLYRTTPTDPVTFFASIALFLTAAFAATFRPARRAANIDPTEALR